MGEFVPEKAIIEGLNYGQVTPETIDCEIKLVKFQPTQALGNIQPNQQVKFLINGAGFLDPYSTYLRFTVSCNEQSNQLQGGGPYGGPVTQAAPELADYEMRFVDRSAHSFINRLYITSNGVEIERIDSYHILAAMIGDSLYSTEQHLFHNFEGFPGQTHTFSDNINTGLDLTYQYNQINISNNALIGSPTAGEAFQASYISSKNRRALGHIISQGAQTDTMTKVGEAAFFNGFSLTANLATNSIVNALEQFNAGTYGVTGDNPVFYDACFNTRSQLQSDNGFITPFSTPTAFQDPLTSDYWYNGLPFSRVQYSEPLSLSTLDTPVVATDVSFTGQNILQFTIPLYSSIIGVLMPRKRLIPLGAVPLDIEFTINPYALYSSLPSGSRNFTITRMEMYAHTLFFQHDIPVAVDNIISSSGLYFHMNTFYMAPKTVIPDATIPGVAQIQLQFNAVNSVHFVFMYQLYQFQAYARQLHFVSHNLNYLQINNGIFLIPSEPIQSTGTNLSSGLTGSSGSSIDGSYIPFFTEYIKSWNRLHDPSMDSGLNASNVCTDLIGCQALPLDNTLPQGYAQQSYSWTYPEYVVGDQSYPQYPSSWQNAAAESNVPLGQALTYNMGILDLVYFEILQKQANIGRAQYGISLEGEQLGEEKTAITGRKCILPFNITMVGQKAQDIPSEMWIFLRHDAILHIRPNTSPQLTR